MRVVAKGSVLVHAHEHERARGRLANVSSTGMCVQLAEGEPRCTRGDFVDVDLHLDRAGAMWLRFRGRVLRAGEHEVAILFTAMPIDFPEVIRDVVLSAVEGATMPHILLVDANADRRVPFAALLRSAGCRVAEVTTPLEAIAHLGSSAIQSWVVAITDTVPASIADELRRFLTESDAPPIDIVALGEQSPTDAVAWLLAAGLDPSPKDLDVD